MAVVDTELVLVLQRKTLAKAKALMESRQGGRSVLIYLATQHPLVENAAGHRDQPGLEFQARIDKTWELVQKFKTRGFLPLVFVSGSRHQDAGIWDTVSLREAAVTALTELGAVPADIVSDETLATIMSDEGLPGIGSTQDEVRVAAREFKQNGDYAYFYAVGGPGQMGRILQNAILNGVMATGIVPEVFDRNGDPVPAAALFHQPDYESVKTFELAAAQLSPEARLEVLTQDQALRDALTVPGTPTEVAISLEIGQD